MNGRRILIRGAGWTSEMMLRYSPERFEQEIAYVKDMGLNTIRLEGKLEDEPFFDIADREGILVMPGLVLLRPLGEVGQVGRRGPAGRHRVAARPDPAPARPRRPSSPG